MIIPDDTQKIIFIVQNIYKTIQGMEYQEIKYPKLATGGLVWGSRPIQPLIERKFHMNIGKTLPEIIINDAKTIEEARINFLKTGINSKKLK